MIRWAIVAVGALLLGSDLIQDFAWFQHSQNTGQLLAAIARNLLLLIGLIGLAADKRWGYLALLLSVLLGLVRRGLFIAPLAELSPADPTFMAFHSGADLAFRLLALAVIVDYLRRDR